MPPADHAHLEGAATTASAVQSTCRSEAAADCDRRGGAAARRRALDGFLRAAMHDLAPAGASQQLIAE